MLVNQNDVMYLTKQGTQLPWCLLAMVRQPNFSCQLESFQQSLLVMSVTNLLYRVYRLLAVLQLDQSLRAPCPSVLAWPVRYTPNTRLQAGWSTAQRWNVVWGSVNGGGGKKTREEGYFRYTHNRQSVLPLRSLALRSAPLRTSSCTTLTIPERAAMCRGLGDRQTDTQRYKIQTCIKMCTYQVCLCNVG